MEDQEQQILAVFKQLKNEHSSIMNKIAELESEANEHTLVINSIENLDPARKCWRLVGAILVGRSVGEVLPAVKRNRDGLLEIVQKLNQQLQAKTKEVNEFAQKYKIVKQSAGGEDQKRIAQKWAKD
eukprot:TRINITY_DN6595_c0_g1_i2.p1 TRINITY_DN6595_c0_g1~~TRINITY_DN6595_c0_g1_i2.p1  ORF type:complete len:127 (-),score=16.70 TRINITY_DN6595_c0_g1_i2:92-472(-)